MPAIVAPQVLLGNHLKALKPPTFAREYEKVAMERGAPDSLRRAHRRGCEGTPSTLAMGDFLCLAIYLATEV
jgi:hypothetical protein